MSFVLRKNRPPAGARPEQIQVPPQAHATSVRAIWFDEHGHEELTIESIEKVDQLQRRGGVLWIDLCGLADKAWLENIGEHFGLHYLTVADIAHIPQQPKFEFHEHYLLFIMAMTEGATELEQLSVVLTKNAVITFQERLEDVFDPVRHRIRSAKGAIRKQKADYLFYALMDAVVDGYYPRLEQCGEALEDLEEELLNDPSQETIHKIYRLKRQFLHMRRALWPTREALSSMVRDQPALIKKTNLVFFRDVYDHLLQVLDVLESYRELSSGLMEVYLSSTNNKMNEVMKTLTVISTIFIPLSFFAGIYGMNFEYMPELKVPWAYPLFLGIMFTIALGLLLYFKRKGWLS